MQAQLTPHPSGATLHIDSAVLQLLGIDPNKAVEITTDGTRLIIGPAKPGSAASHLSRSGDALLGSPDFFDPKVTIALLDELVELGLREEHFHKLHHFGAKAWIPTHRNYCAAKSRFRTRSNVVVAGRLHSCLQAKRAGKSWEEAIGMAQAAHRFDGEA